MSTEDWKNKYYEATTWKDADNMLDELKITEMKQIARGLKITKKWFGIGMRQEFFLVIIEAKIKRAEREE